MGKMDVNDNNEYKFIQVFGFVSMLSHAVSRWTGNYMNVENII